MSKIKNTLELLFESRARVKMLKFLFRNIGAGFTAKELVAKTQEPITIVNEEIKNFIEIGLIKIRR